MRLWTWIIGVGCLAGMATAPAAAAPDRTPPPAALVRLFDAWRAAASPPRRDDVADFSSVALAGQAAELRRLKHRLAALDRAGWRPAAIADAALIDAEMNGLDFDLRVRQPWARDPSYYATVFGEESDVPAHEGPSADTIDLFRYRYPLSPGDARDLTKRLAGVPVLLARARVTLADGNAADLWRYGGRALDEQADVLAALAAGTLTMRTIDGPKRGTLAGAGAPVSAAALAAEAATREFARWVAVQAPTKTGPSGVGKDNYDWYMKHVQLVPYDWDEQVVLLQRELDRAWAGLAMEQVRNRSLPPATAITDPAAYRSFAAERMKNFTDFIIGVGFVPEQPFYRAALAAQTVDYIPPAKRNFFHHVTALDPRPLYAHDIHWVELARIRQEPHPDPIRRTAPLFNIFAARSEGFATAFEELTMQAGLYDDSPRGRELVWIMLANRAARGLASLHVQANTIDLAAAGRFHAAWTPRGWSDPDNVLVGFEQLLYLRQPGYGTSYVTGKLLLDARIAAFSQEADRAHRTPPSAAAILSDIADQGILPWPLLSQPSGDTMQAEGN